MNQATQLTELRCPYCDQQQPPQYRACDGQKTIPRLGDVGVCADCDEGFVFASPDLAFPINYDGLSPGEMMQVLVMRAASIVTKNRLAWRLN